MRVATVADVFGGRVVLLAFDGSSDVHFIDKSCTDIYPIGWSENTDSVLFTPHGPGKQILIFSLICWLLA